MRNIYEELIVNILHTTIYNLRIVVEYLNPKKKKKNHCSILYGANEINPN